MLTSWIGSKCAVPTNGIKYSYVCSECDSTSYILMWGGDCIKESELSLEGKINTSNTGIIFSSCGIIGCKVCNTPGGTCNECKSNLYLNTFSDNENGCYAGCIEDGAEYAPLMGKCSRCHGLTHCKMDYFSCWGVNQK